MRRSSYGVGALIALSLLVPRYAQAEKAAHSVTYDSRSLESTLWYPDKLAVIRGVLVFTGGQGDGVSVDTRALADNEYWQRFAESVGFAILGNQFHGPYTKATDGPGQALLDTLSGLATTTQHPELAHAPLLLEGFSNGGYFSFTFTQFAPSRVIAFCLNKSGYAQAPLDAAFLAVPGLLVWGSEEPVSQTPTVIHSLVQQARPKHALWAELKEWGADHVDGSPERVYVPFFAEMIAARYPKNVTPLQGDVALLALTESNGWLADHSADSVNADLPLIAAFAEYHGDAQAASWLPSEGLAKLWRGFTTKTPIGLSSPALGALLDVNQPVQLTATDLRAGETASFLAGSEPLAERVVATAGVANATWDTKLAGAAGLIALAVDANGTPTRTSRPVHVLLSGKLLEHVPALDAGVDVPDAEPMDAESADATNHDASQTPAADGGEPQLLDAGDAVDHRADANVDANADANVDAGKPRHRDAPASAKGARLGGGSGCAVTGGSTAQDSGAGALVIGCALGLLLTRARRRA